MTTFSHNLLKLNMSKMNKYGTHLDIDSASDQEGFQLIDEDNIPTSSHDLSSRKPKYSQAFKYGVLVAIFLIISFASLSVYNYSSSSSVNVINEVDIPSIKELIKPKKRIYFYNFDDETIEDWFKAYIDEFNKEYGVADEEYPIRLNNFKAALALADERNKKEASNGGSAIHGITFLSDRSENEKKVLRGYKKATTGVKKFDPIHFVPPTYEGDDTSRDWTGIYTTAVKDQGYCGSCWAFSATEQIEADAKKDLGLDVILSPQQIVSCDGIDYGCDGGDTEQAYQYVAATGGLSLESSYPYEDLYGDTLSCRESEISNVVTVQLFATLVGEDRDYTNVETKMYNYVMKTGPLSICLDASTWDYYTSGVVTTCSTDIDHCVQVVGIDTVDGIKAWKVRNSWSTQWGDDGFIWLKYGENTCGITHDPTFVIPRLPGYFDEN